MNACIPQRRDEVAETAPKITTIYIPLDKVGEVIGPKGKVINTIQQETGADISVDDDGARGIVTIGAVEAWRMEEAKAAILAIVDPPKAELGKIYNGRVVNITKFGAFVNILPGRDGLVHISKLGRGKRINAVEDVLSLARRSRSVSTRSTTRARSASSPSATRRQALEGGDHHGDSRVRSGTCPPRTSSTERSSGNGSEVAAGGDRRRGQLRRQLRRRTRQRTRRPRPEERAPRRDHQWWP